jgi:hypothetical protein
MILQRCRELLSHRPFQPFRLVMMDGRTFEVQHPDMAMLTKSDLLVGVGGFEEGVPADFRICSLLHVSSIEPIGTSTSGPR